MDHRSTITAKVAQGTIQTETGLTVAGDQAIFTSSRSPMGQGYRIIASSPGVRTDEKKEITQRSPSHDSMCDPDPEAVGLLSYAMDSGRLCIAYCCHAGHEQTARGGERVYSHMVLLDKADYRLFSSDPVQIHALMGRLVKANGPILDPLTRLQTLSLHPPERQASQKTTEVLPGFLPNRPEWIWALAPALLSGKRLVFVGADDPLSLLEWSLLSIPCSMREQVDLSVGLKFSTNRRAQLTFVPDNQDGNFGTADKQNIDCWDINSIPQLPENTYEPWFNLLRRWWQEKRFADLVRLTTHLCPHTPKSSLARVAECYEKLDRERITLNASNKTSPLTKGG